jgi:hypothetical protein
MRHGFALAAASALVISLLFVGAAAAEAKATKCQVINVNTHRTFVTLQAAIDAASAGATISVQGTCLGSTTITKDLTITGQDKHGTAPATLDGGHVGRVLTVGPGVTVTLSGLHVTGGTADYGGGIATPGIFNPLTTVTVIDSVISGNAATYGGGIANRIGKLTLIDSIVSDNTAALDGGGILNSLDTGCLILNGTSAVRGNHAGSRGGGIVAGNHTGCSGRGVTLNGAASVDHNTAGGDGAGIYIMDSLVTLNDGSSVHHNSASGNGGGVAGGGAPATLDLTGTSSIRDNTAANGAGVYFTDSVVSMTDMSSISGNVATGDGGGIYSLHSGVSLGGTSSIRDNTATSGGGIYHVIGSLTVSGAAAITGNTPDDYYPPEDGLSLD